MARHPVIIPYGVRTTEERTCYSADPFTIAYCGRMVEEQKRASLVVRTLIAACQQGQHIRAVLMGEGKARPACQQLVQEAGLADRIVFTGALDAAAVRAQLLKSQALLLMSDYEGLPVALLEAMALGVPVIVSDAGNLPDLVGEPELVVEGDGPEGWTRMFEWLDGNHVRLASLGRSCRERIVQHYSMDQCGESTTAVYERAIMRRLSLAS